MKKLLPAVIVFALFCFGCHKDKKQTPGGGDTGLHIQIVKGNNQKDTIGNLLKDSIVVKVTSDGMPAGNYIVQFKRSGCEDVTITEATTGANGQASFGWYLSGQTGGQLLDIVLLDAGRNEKDSVSAMATGIEAAHGWHRSGCVQNFPVNTVSELNTGRLLCALNGNNYPYYSDDNAASWHPLTSFSSSHFITKIITDSQNDIFLATQNDGLYYSSDNGQSWSNRTSGITDPTNFSDMAYTRSGRLIFCSNSGVYISSDKGQNWEEDDFGLPFGQSSYPCEDSNGILYIIGSDYSLYKSTNGGGKWNIMNNILLSNVESVFVDTNDDIYIGIPHNGPGVDGLIFRSSDGGNTWTQLFSQTTGNSSYPNITQISKMGSMYYFSFAGSGVFQTSDFSSYSNITTRFASYGLLSYTLAKNSSLVIGSPGYGIFYYVP
ncbi:MAG TPA: sialidase family protein [Mucilaginibacter sp.]|nr:sialidase family protein [Mucilaginibacter sp.]